MTSQQPWSSAPGDPTPVDDGGLHTPLGRAATVMTGFVALLWLVHLINLATDYRLSAQYGIRARQPGSLPDILTAPFLHANVEHLVGNAAALFNLGLVTALLGVRRFLAATVFVIVVSGFGAWLFDPAGTVGVGASGIVFGYLGYLMLRGLVNRRPVDVMVAIGIALSWGAALAGVLPGDPGVSWQAHLSGLVAGLVAAWLFRDRRPAGKPEPPATPPPTLPGIEPAG